MAPGNLVHFTKKNKVLITILYILYTLILRLEKKNYDLQTLLEDRNRDLTGILDDLHECLNGFEMVKEEDDLDNLIYIQNIIRDTKNLINDNDSEC